MALNKTAIKSKLASLFLSLESNEDPKDAREKLLEGLTETILLAFSQAEVPVTITTVGSATTQQGFVNAKII